MTMSNIESNQDNNKECNQGSIPTGNTENRNTAGNTENVKPVWLKEIFLVELLLGLIYVVLPSNLHSANPVVHLLQWIYPFYTLVSLTLAWLCHGRYNRLMWAVLTLLTLSHLAIYLMATTMVH